MILLAVLPPLLALAWWGYDLWRKHQELHRELWERIVESCL
jgi:hypothetical protein